MANENTLIERLPNREDAASLITVLDDIADALQPKEYSWAKASDETIVELVQKADAGEVDLYLDYGWTIGDEREVQLSAIEAGANNVAHAAQKATLVLMDYDHFYLADGVTKCKYVVGFKGCLDEGVYFQDSASNAISWEDSRARKECDAVYAMFPDYLKSILKKFLVYSTRGKSYSGGVDSYSNSYLALPSYPELGILESSSSFFNPDEYTYMSSLEYYRNIQANLVKDMSGPPYYYWSRTPMYRNDGASYQNSAYYVIGVANGTTPVDGTIGIANSDMYYLSPIAVI